MYPIRSTWKKYLHVSVELTSSERREIAWQDVGVKNNNVTDDIPLTTTFSKWSLHPTLQRFNYLLCSLKHIETCVWVYKLLRIYFVLKIGLRRRPGRVVDLKFSNDAQELKFPSRVWLSFFLRSNLTWRENRWNVLMSLTSWRSKRNSQTKVLVLTIPHKNYETTHIKV